MTTLKTGVLAALLVLSPPAFAQSEQAAYQCSSGGSLNSGFVATSIGGLQVVAKYKDGIVQEVSGLIASDRAMRNSNPYLDMMRSSANFTYADMAKWMMQVQNFATTGDTSSSPFTMGMGGGMGGGLSGGYGMVTPAANSKTKNHDDLDDDISTARPGDQVPKRAGDTVAARAGDQVSVMRSGDQKAWFQTNQAEPRTGDLVVMNGVTTFSASLSSQGKISEISYRNGKKLPAVIRVEAQNPPAGNSVYNTLNGALESIKTFASCCARGTSSRCQIVDRPSAQTSLQTVKPASRQESGAGGSTLMMPFNRASGSDAK